MRVIEEKPWTLGIVCKSCGSKLEVEATDVRAVEFEISDCDHTALHAKCPVCFGEINLAGLVPPGIRDKAIERYRKGKKRGYNR